MGRNTAGKVLAVEVPFKVSKREIAHVRRKRPFKQRPEGDGTPLATRASDGGELAYDEWPKINGHFAVMMGLRKRQEHGPMSYGVYVRGLGQGARHGEPKSSMGGAGGVRHAWLLRKNTCAAPRRRGD